jgi:hypothetical protein
VAVGPASLHVVRLGLADAIRQLVGFRARSLLDDISEHARKEIYNIVEAIEGWATQIIRDESDEYQRELDTVGTWLVRTPSVNIPKLDAAELLLGH